MKTIAFKANQAQIEALMAVAKAMKVKIDTDVMEDQVLFDLMEKGKKEGRANQTQKEDFEAWLSK